MNNDILMMGCKKKEETYDYLPFYTLKNGDLQWETTCPSTFIYTSSTLLGFPAYLTKIFNITSIKFPKITTIDTPYAVSAKFFGNTSELEIHFPKLSSITNSSGIFFLADESKNISFYFPALSSVSSKYIFEHCYGDGYIYLPSALKSSNFSSGMTIKYIL